MPSSAQGKKMFAPAPKGFHKAVLADVYFRYDVEMKWQESTKLRDLMFLVFQLDPAVGLTHYEGKDVPFWVTLRQPIMCERQKDGSPIMYMDYEQLVLRNRDNIIKPNMDENGEPYFVLTPRMNLYKLLLGWAGDDFLKALASGSLVWERLVQKQAQFQVNVTHSEPDKNGQIWPRITGLAPGQEGQKLVPVDYVRMKDRVDEEEEEEEETLPF